MLHELDERALKDLIKQWNIAERRIKAAENLRAGEVVSSAIFELRYAGRKIIDAMVLALDNQIKGNADLEKKVADYLADATEDCVKAKHDAIDAMLNFITEWFDTTERVLGLAKLQTFFPRYMEITATIADLQDKIAESRGDRVSSRDGIYDEIEKNDYPAILALYNTMRQSRERVGAVVQADRRKDNRQLTATIIGLILGAAGAIELAISLLSTH